VTSLGETLLERYTVNFPQHLS